MQNLMRGEPLKLVDGGHSQRTFIFIKDAIDAVLRMIVSACMCPPLTPSSECYFLPSSTSQNERTVLGFIKETPVWISDFNIQYILHTIESSQLYRYLESV